jgi:C1A family cysteine protease
MIIALLALVAFAKSADVYEAEFNRFVMIYGKNYSSVEETLSRFDIFRANFDLITEHNAKQLDWSLDVNEFADMTWSEFRTTHLGYTPRLGSNHGGVSLAGVVNVPASIDWSSKGAVTAIKNQGQCGSCWAFSTTGSTEGAVEIKTGRLTSLSEQQLVDCSTAQGNQGCNGGLMDYGFEYIISNGGLCSEAEYPYQGVDGTCDKSCSIVSKIKSYKDVSQNDQTALQAAVAMQPVSVAIEADQMGFQFYSKGVFSGACGTNLDHGVLAVGYGTQDGKDFWKVKNSWGASWGLNGYILLVRSSSSGAGQCGIAMQPSYPIA